MGKGDRRTHAKVRKSSKKPSGSKIPPHNRSACRTAQVVVCLAPTPQQDGKGLYRRAQGPGRTEVVVNLWPDMIGRLLDQGDITPEQEQAARTFQDLRAGFLAQTDIRSFRSCLDTSQGGYDPTDGDAGAVAAYRAMERRIGSTAVSVLCSEVDKLPHQKPHILGQLQWALDRVIG